MPTHGKATTTRSTFRLEVAVSTLIKAKPETIWALLTHAKDFPRWNSMVQEIEGNIALGETIRLKVPYAAGRTFTLKVTQFAPSSAMVWQDGTAPIFQGVRRFSIEPNGDGSAVFTMAETYAGLMLPLIAGSLPDLAPSFERYAADLKQEAEQSA